MPTDAFIDEPALHALRRHFAQHNGQAVMLAFFSFLVAGALWGTIYAFTYWFVLVGVTLQRSFNVDTITQITDPHLISPYFPAYFAAGAAVALVLAQLMRRWVKPDKLREKRHYFLWVAVEVFMAVPNITFSIWGNLSAIVRLRPHETVKAWQLLRFLHDSGGRLRLSNLRVEIEDEKTLDRVMRALQLSGLVGIQESREEGWFLYLQNQEALALLWQASAAE
jgi:hypothetical protein